MMTVPADEAERLAEIFREIFALSERNQPNHSQSTPVDDSIKSFDRQGQSGTPESPKGKQASDKRMDAENQEPRR
jgi:hypothetical protein